MRSVAALPPLSRQTDRALRDSFGNMNVPSSQAVLWLRTAPSGSGAVSAWVAIVKDKNNGLNGMARRGQQKKEELGSSFLLYSKQIFFNLAFVI